MSNSPKLNFLTPEQQLAWLRFLGEKGLPFGQRWRFLQDLNDEIRAGNVILGVEPDAILVSDKSKLFPPLGRQRG